MKMQISVLNRHIICGDESSSWGHPICLAVWEGTGFLVDFKNNQVWKTRDYVLEDSLKALTDPLQIPNPLEPFTFSLSIPTNSIVETPPKEGVVRYLKIFLVDNIRTELARMLASGVGKKFDMEKNHLEKAQFFLEFYGKLTEDIL